MHVGIPQLDGFQQAGVPELEPWIRQRVEGEINWLWPLAGGEDRVTGQGDIRDTQPPAPQAPALTRPYLSQLCLVTQHVLHVACKPGRGINRGRDRALLSCWYPRPGVPQDSPTALQMAPLIPPSPPGEGNGCPKASAGEEPAHPRPEAAPSLSPVLTVAVPVHGALAEDHDVLGEGAGFVREDVLHLPQLLVEGGGPGLGWRAALGTVHLLVPVDEVAVPEPDHLHAAWGAQPGVTGEGSTLC